MYIHSICVCVYIYIYTHTVCAGRQLVAAGGAARAEEGVLALGYINIIIIIIYISTITIMFIVIALCY